VASLVLTVFLLFTFLPEVSLYMINHHISPLRSSAGQASLAQVKKLEANP
jgi:hypothetical protein